MESEARVLQLEKIKQPLFLVGLVLLLLNDFYLKYAFSNAITGKLSDLAGLFIFPFFFSAILPKAEKIIYWLTALAFTLWKLPFSQPLIDLVNAYGIGISRTIDVSDLWTLAILPFSYCYFKETGLKERKSIDPIMLLVAVVSVFSFFATTLPRKDVKIQTDLNKVFVLDQSKEIIINRLTAGHSYSDSIQKNLKDSSFYLYFQIPELRADLTALATIKELDSITTIIKLDSIVGCNVTGSKNDEEYIARLKAMKSYEFEKEFEEEFIKPLKSNKIETGLFFDNKEIHDKIEKEDKTSI